MHANRGRIQRAVKALLSRGGPQSELDSAVEIGPPIPVVHPDGTQRSWFVPLVAGPKLAGFVELLPSLAPLRLSSFQRRGRIDDLAPNVSDWTDPERIRGRASMLVREGEQLSTPILTYDGDPRRLAWKLVATSQSGEARVLFVAGTAVYVAADTSGAAKR
jgi:hypothetical protein